MYPKCNAGTPGIKGNPGHFAMKFINLRRPGSKPVFVVLPTENRKYTFYINSVKVRRGPTQQDLESLLCSLAGQLEEGDHHGAPRGARGCPTHLPRLRHCDPLPAGPAPAAQGGGDRQQEREQEGEAGLRGQQRLVGSISWKYFLPISAKYFQRAAVRLRLAGVPEPPQQLPHQTQLRRRRGGRLLLRGRPGGRRLWGLRVSSWLSLVQDCRDCPLIG